MKKATSRPEEKLIRRVFEVRYDPSYLFWDNAGKIWGEVSQSFAVSKSSTAEPNMIRQTLDGKFDVQVSIDRAHVIWVDDQKSDDKYHLLADRLVQSAIKYLKVKHFTRIGTRLIYRAEFDEPVKASEYLKQKGYFPNIDGSYFNIRGQNTSLEKMVRWEDEDIGIIVKAGVVEATLNADLPLEWAGYATSYNTKIVSASTDVDYYTRKNVSVDQLNAQDWLEQAKDVIEEDLERFLKETT